MNFLFLGNWPTKRKKHHLLTPEPKSVRWQQRNQKVPPNAYPQRNQPPPKSPLENHPLVNETKEHWKEHRPKLYAELQKNGQLHQRAVKAVDQTQEELLDLVNQGANYDQAWEAVRERHMFLPSEEDQPDLGESPDNKPLEHALDTTTTSRKPMKSEPEESAASTETTFPPLEP